MIILMAGLPGSGKTTLARELAARSNSLVLNKDEIRASVFPREEIEYSTVQDDFCVRVMLDLSAITLNKTPSQRVFLDGRPFSRRYQVNQVVEFAEWLGQPWRILHCVCSEETARMRLQEGHVAENRDFELYRRMKAVFEPIERPQLVIDTDRPLTQCVDEAERWLAGSSDSGGATLNSSQG